jgi:2-methylcitrate dehydratase PrpD
MELTAGISHFALQTELADVPADVLAVSRDMMLNAAGVGLAGSRAPTARMILEHVQEMGGVAECTVMAEGWRTSPELAALANGAMVHVLDFDETFERRGNHPSAAIFPTVMVMGERYGLAGRDVLAAFVIGCEVSTKVGAIGALDELKPTIFKNGWHLTGVVGTIGAAAAAGRLLNLDQEKMENALGIAASMAAGLQVNYGHSVKALHAGRAAMNGVTSARLAAKGFTGARTAIEAADGFLGAFHGDPDLDAQDFLAHLANPFDVIDPGVGIKNYPCATTTHAAIFAAGELTREHDFAPEDIESVLVSVPELGGRTESRNAFPHPRTGLEAKFSVAYCTAVSLVHGMPRMHHFTDEAVKDPALVPILDRLVLTMDEVPTVEHHMPCTVRVTLRDGRVLTHRAMSAKGHRANPLTAAEVDDKFRYCADGRLSPGLIAEVITGFRDIHNADNVSSLFAKLGQEA